MRRLQLVLSVITLLALSTYLIPASAQGTSTPTLLAEIKINDSQNVKFPSIAVTGQTIHAGGGIRVGSSSRDNTDAFTWAFAEQATSIGSGISLGPALGQPDYSTVALAPAPDGSLYAVWSSINDRTISVRRRDASGAWGARHIVTSGGFPIFPQVTVASNGQVFTAWQDVDAPVFIKVSSDQGASWPSTFTTAGKAYSVQPMLSAGPSGQVVLAYTTIDLNAAVGIWTGAGFSTELLTGKGVAADVTASVGPDGKLYAVWRGLDSSGNNSGVFYAERQAANSWAKSQLTPGEVKGAVNIVVDSGGSVHLGWIASVSGNLRFYYAFRQAGQPQFSSSVATNVSGLFNSRLAISSAGAFAHASLENFSGSVPFITYARFSGGATPAATLPKIEGDAPVIGLKTSVAVSFVNVTNNPTQVRWSWGSPPTDSSNDSNGWQTFASPMTIAVPSRITSGATCTTVRLYTQVRNSTQMELAQFDQVIIDGSVTASVAMTNPHLARRAAQFSDLADLAGDGGASDGDPSYTREPVAYIEIRGVNECSGVNTMATARSVTRVAPSRKVAKNFFANVLPFPGAFAIGSNSVMVRVRDNAGNSKDYTQTLIYDVTPPVLDGNSPGSLSATPNAEATILTSLKFASVNVSDNAYPGRGFWGVWIANSRTPVANPSTDAGLIWTPLAAPGSGTTFTITNWSLSNGLTASQLTPGNYTIYVRFLDGAGNPTAGVLSTTVSLTNVTMPKTSLPIVRR